ncbi:filamentous hemagglutinin N-terminal domain-containing protein [Benzoatithermus flavus]|uniref:Filamentous hemagglutinin N-terminal domain-containing protein n=1 Tax=Benzoatithermus flavus TaxID=3108223 RepID=A0ABU8XMC7_9PROT
MAHRRDYGRLVGLALGTLLWPVAGAAEVATDGTLGPRLRLAGPEVTIPARLGRIRGQNLFHSFARFGVEEGQRVTFTGPSGLKNIIGRVTGGAPSTIDGTLRSKVPGADLWLLNPAGILFGPNAKLDVKGSFHASTADELRFADGAVFSAREPGGSVLSVAAPQAFGFLGARPAPVTVDRSVLDVPEGQALSLTGGDVTIRGNSDGIANGTEFADEPGTVRARAGRITLAALGGPGAVAVKTGKATGAVSGVVHLSGEASVIASGDGGGTIRIQGGRLVAENSSYVFADNFGRANAEGGVAIRAGDVSLADGSWVTASTFDTGNAGRVTVDADSIELRDAGQISSATFGSGRAGEVAVTAGHLTVTGDPASFLVTGIFSPAELGSTGDAGRVTVKADTIELRATGVISSTTFGSGDAGEVMVTAGHLTVTGDPSSSFVTGILSRAAPRSTGNAGRVTVDADSIELRYTGQISSSTFGPGSAGEVAVTTGRLSITGDPAAPFNLTSISSDAASGSTGPAGRVTVGADSIELQDTGQISSSTFGAGDAGEVAVTAGHLTVTGDPASTLATGIFSRAAARSTGDAGRVTVGAGSIELRDTGQISSATFGPGDAGEVSIRAGRLTISNGGTVQTNSEDATGAAGNVSIDATSLIVRDGGEISSSGTGTGPAGDVQLTADTLEVEGASIRTVGAGSQGGRIDVASDLIRLRDAELISTGLLPEAGRSVITLQAPLIAFNNSRVASLTETGRLLEGISAVQLFGGTTVISSDSLVAGVTPENEIGSELTVPQGVFLNADNLLRESCAARRSATASSFTAMGRGGLPRDPAKPLPGAYVDPDRAPTAPVGPRLATRFGEGCRTAPGG